ncbi:MAG: serine hydroxymethyltransferase, partial [Oscillospiraceae bacterium]|nr:serine hydroxymethyltransferase [Oscillospiraceae bacterium]
ALQPSFAEYQRQVRKNARALAQGLLRRGVSLVSGGTDNHLLLLDLRSLGITGKELERRLDEVYITVNKNAIPNDPEKPFVTSGVRIGTPAVTSRGFREAEMEQIAEAIFLAATDFEAKAESLRQMVNAICGRHALY